ncbi:MAG: FAD-dependent oxidoreductase [Lachnospirales bacterium]
MKKYEMLLSPMKIGNVEIKNRVVMPAMCLGHGQFNGNPTEQLMDYYEERAKGGVGLIIPGITRINDVTGLAHFAQLSVSSDKNIEPLKELGNRIHKYGSKMFIQLHHPGYQNLNLLMGIGPSTIAMDKVIPNFKSTFFKMSPLAQNVVDKGACLAAAGPSKVEPCDYNMSKNRALSHKEVKNIIKQFIDGARRVKEAGMDGVEIHAAHGYLLNEFLSLRTNHRTDEYGGNFENRMRILKEIIEGIREVCGEDFPISVRISATEGYDKIGLEGKKSYGYAIDEGVKIAKALESYGIDVLNVSAGTYETMNYIVEPVTYDEGWRTEYIKQVREAVSLPIIAVNMIRTPEKAEELLQSGLQDFVGLGRTNIADPYWVKKTKENRENEIKRCISCLYCFESMFENAFKGSHGQCAVNPSMGEEAKYKKIKKDGKGRTVIVVGAGPAGLMSAEILARRGFNTVLFEKNNSLGGQLNLANKPPHKDKISWCYEDLENVNKKLGVIVIKSWIATKKDILSYNPYAVIIATGGSALKPKSIKGVECENVCTVTEILSGEVNLENKKVAVIGSGLTGLETAEYLVEKGNKVAVVEMADKISPDTYEQHKRDIMPKLKKGKTSFLPNKKLEEISENGVKILDMKTNKKFKLECDNVVLALGVSSVNTLYDELKGDVQNLYKVGDSNKIGRIAEAVRSGYEIASTL